MTVSSSLSATTTTTMTAAAGKRNHSPLVSPVTTAIFAPVLAVLLVYHLDSFEPAAMPTDILNREVNPVPLCNPHMLIGSEKIGEGLLYSPEDMDYDPDAGSMYVTCVDGWVKRVTVNESSQVVDNLFHTGGRPLGIVRGLHDDLIVADAVKGLVRVTKEGKMETLTDEAEGVKFKLTNAVDVAKDDGMIYFSDTSYKYSLKDFMWDYLEGKPHGRLLRYDPSTEQTSVLIRDLYVANGVAVSPDNSFVIVCEPPLRRCLRYYIRGEKKGTVDVFIEKMPGMPDNIRYDGDGHYWIAIASEVTYQWYMILRYPFMRKVMGIMDKYKIRRPYFLKNGGALGVDLEGKAIAYYHEPQVSLIASVLKIDDALYLGSVVNPYLLRLNLTLHPALPLHPQSNPSY